MSDELRKIFDEMLDLESDIESDYLIGYAKAVNILANRLQSIIERMESHPPADAGMVRVPREPTPDMVDAGVLDLYGTRTFMVTSGDVERENVTDCYKSMIAAAEGKG